MPFGIGIFEYAILERNSFYDFITNIHGTICFFIVLELGGLLRLIPELVRIV